MTRWVVDSSPLIFLAKLDRLDLLREGADEILAPPAVLQEVRSHPDSASRMVGEAVSTWLKIRPIEDLGTLAVLLGDLGPGEAEAIALSRQVGADRVVMDDLDGRRFARRLGVIAVGTLASFWLPACAETCPLYALRLSDCGLAASECLRRL